MNSALMVFGLYGAAVLIGIIIGSVMHFVSVAWYRFRRWRNNRRFLAGKGGSYWWD